MREKRQQEMPRKNAGADRDRRRECRAGNIVGGGGDAERDNEEGMSLHKILGRSRIMRRGAERDRRCNEITNMYRNSRLTLPLKLKFRIGNDRRNVEGGDGDAGATQAVFKHSHGRSTSPHPHFFQLPHGAPPALWATRWFKGSFNQIN